MTRWQQRLYRLVTGKHWMCPHGKATWKRTGRFFDGGEWFRCDHPRCDRDVALIG